MRINVPKKIKEDLELIESVYVEMDDTTQPGSDTLKVHVNKLHFEKMEFVNVFDHQWQNCSFVQYRLKYLDGREEVIAFESKEKATYQEAANRCNVDTHGFEDKEFREDPGWREGRGEISCSYAPVNIVSAELLAVEDFASITRTVAFPSVGTFSLKNGVISSKGFVYTHDFKQRYVELSRLSSFEELNKDSRETKIYFSKQLHKMCSTVSTRYYKGRALNLYTLYSNYNFCHGFLDLCALLSSCDLAGTNFKEFDWYVVPENNFALSEDLLSRLGIDKSKCLFTGETKVDDKVEPRSYSLMFDELLTPSFNGICSYYAPGAFDFVRRLYTDELAAQGKRRRIYLSREGGVRGISNEQDLVNLLKAYGFTVVASSTQVNMPELMNSATIVVGAHGAAMANCVFCAPKTKLVDLLPAGYAYPYYMSLSNSIGLEYSAFVCRSKGKGAAIKADFMVDIPKLKVLLDQLCYE